MNSTIKTNLGKLLADALRYYHFDRFVYLIVENLGRRSCSSGYDSKNFVLSLSACSDSLVEEACGGESAAKSFKEQDKKGFRDSEVILLDSHPVPCVAAYYVQARD